MKAHVIMCLIGAAICIGVAGVYHSPLTILLGWPSSVCIMVAAEKWRAS